MTEVRINSRVFGYVGIAVGLIFVVCSVFPWAEVLGDSYNAFGLAGNDHSGLGGASNFQKFIPAGILIAGLLMVVNETASIMRPETERLFCVIDLQLLLLAIVFSLVFYGWGALDLAGSSASVGPTVALTFALVGYIFTVIQAAAVLRKYEIYS